MSKLRNKILIICVCLVVAACNNNSSSIKSHERLFTVEEQTLANPLFFSGIIQPLKTIVVTSPAEGVIEDMPFHYGDEVKSSQTLFVVSSEKFKTDYKNTLMQFIKAKNEFSNAKSQLTESKFLHTNQLISEDDYKSKQSAYYNAQLSLVQAQDALTAMLKQVSMPSVTLDQLNIENIDKITQAMNMQSGAQKIKVLAPAQGVALTALKTGSDDTKKLERGDIAKQGDVLAVIGDTSGLSIHINVNEFTINQLQIGQKVKVTGAAFPGMVLEGQITGLDHQGQVAVGGMPNFAVEIIVPQLTNAQRSIIHIGMSAKVEIAPQASKKIIIPLSAIIQKQNDTFVKCNQDGTIKEVAVKTGETTLDSVVIESGLKVGDKIIVSS